MVIEYTYSSYFPNLVIRNLLNIYFLSRTFVLDLYRLNHLLILKQLTFQNLTICTYFLHSRIHLSTWNHSTGRTKAQIDYDLFVMLQEKAFTDGIPEELIKAVARVIDKSDFKNY